jgi:hypothetical protein
MQQDNTPRPMGFPQARGVDLSGQVSSPDRSARRKGCGAPEAFWLPNYPEALFSRSVTVPRSSADTLLTGSRAVRAVAAERSMKSALQKVPGAIGC